MATRSPKTPTSAKKLGRVDPHKTPTRKRPLPGLRLDPPSPRTPPRRNSFEEIAVSSLPDPRTPEHIAFLDSWSRHDLESSQLSLAEFMPALERDLARRNRLPEYNRFFYMLLDNARHATVSLREILVEACALFGRDRTLVQAFNDVLPPGYRLETHRDYVAVWAGSEPPFCVYH